MALLVEERIIPPATPVKHPKSPNEELVQVCMAYPGQTAIGLFEKCFSVSSQKDAMNRLRALFEMENPPVRRESAHDADAKRTLFHYYPTEFAASYTDSALKSDEGLAEKPGKPKEKKAKNPDVTTKAPSEAGVNPSLTPDGTTEPVSGEAATHEDAQREATTRDEGVKPAPPRKASQKSRSKTSAERSRPSSSTANNAAAAAMAEKDAVIENQANAVAELTRLLEEGAQRLLQQRQRAESLEQQLIALQAKEKSRAGYIVLPGNLSLIPSMEEAREEVERRIKEGERSLYIAGITSKAEMVVNWTE